MNQGNQYDAKSVMPEVIRGGLMVSLCSITVPPQVFDGGGAPIAAAAYVPYSDPTYANIPCTAPPLSTGDKVQPTEAKELSQVMAKNLLHVLLDGYFPAVIATYRAIIDGTEYDIVGVESDSQKQMTRLAVQKVTI